MYPIFPGIIDPAELSICFLSPEEIIAITTNWKLVKKRLLNLEKCKASRALSELEEVELNQLQKLSGIRKMATKKQLVKAQNKAEEYIGEQLQDA